MTAAASALEVHLLAVASGKRQGKQAAKGALTQHLQHPRNLGSLLAVKVEVVQLEEEAPSH